MSGVRPGFLALVSSVVLTCLPGCEIIGAVIIVGDHVLLGAPSYVASSISCLKDPYADTFDATFSGFSREEMEKVIVERMEGENVIETMIIQPEPFLAYDSNDKIYYIQYSSFVKNEPFKKLRFIVSPQDVFIVSKEHYGARACGNVGRKTCETCFVVYNCGTKGYTIDNEYVKKINPVCLAVKPEYLREVGFPNAYFRKKSAPNTYSLKSITDADELSLRQLEQIIKLADEVMQYPEPLGGAWNGVLSALAEHGFSLMSDKTEGRDENDARRRIEILKERYELFKKKIEAKPAAEGQGGQS